MSDPMEVMDKREQDYNAARSAAADHREPLDAEFIAAVQRLTEEVYIPHHTPSSESGPEEWDVELWAPEAETVEAVIRHLARLSDSGRPQTPEDPPVGPHPKEAVA